MGLPAGKATHSAICPAVRRLARKRRSTGDGDALPLSLGYKVHVASVNNFPTAAGLASSAAGYACLGGCPQTLGDLGSALW